MMIENKLQEVQELVNSLGDLKGSVSDGFHTFD